MDFSGVPSPEKIEENERKYRENLFLATTPIPPLPDKSTLDLWRKAVTERDNWTEDEKFAVLERRPPSACEEICQAQLKMSMENLMDKALKRPDTLTTAEIQFLIDSRFPNASVGEPSSQASISEQVQYDLRFLPTVWGQPEDVRQLWEAAVEGLDDPQSRENVAYENASKAKSERADQRQRFFNQFNSSDIRNIRRSCEMGWVERMKERNEPRWGFVCFRTDFDDNIVWKRYKERVTRLSILAIQLPEGADGLERKWKVQFIEDLILEGADLRLLIQHFKSLVDRADGIDQGLRQDVFLLADNECIALTYPGPLPAPTDYNRPPIPGCIKAVDVTYDSSKTYEHGFRGSLKVGFPHISTTFYHRLLPRGEEAPKYQDPDHPDSFKQSWERMAEKSQWETINNIYPPKPMLNG